MLDIKLIKKEPKAMQESLAKKGFIIDFTEILERESKKNVLLHEAGELRNKRNILSKEIGAAIQKGENADEIKEKVNNVNDKIAKIENEINILEEKNKEILIALPNPSTDDTPAGGKENNEIISHFGAKPNFVFKPKNHIELCQMHGLIDYEKGAKIGGSGNWIYTDRGARLEWALLNYFIESHLADRWEMMLIPHVLNETCGTVAGQFPKFADDVFHLEGKGKFLLPTAETALVNLHNNEILNEKDLPKKYFAFTPCYRKEAGGGHADERGMIRGPQFNKVELVQFAHPDNSEAEHKKMLEKAEKLVQGLGLHYRVSRLAAEDCSWSMASTYDVEVWIPSMQIYKEVSSASNAGDYQARRGGARFKDKDTKENRFLHTLNASGLATSRIFPALLEQHQQADGSIKIPECLVKYTGFDRICDEKI
ncbi:MAG: serine--tRNA ligase [Oscillospiraceae bacterium]|nr:serine--tRNA ligase [Oscillospiraceae bacterium]